MAAGILTQVMLAFQAVSVAAQWFAHGRHGNPPLKVPGNLYNATPVVNKPALTPPAPGKIDVSRPAATSVTPWEGNIS